MNLSFLYNICFYIILELNKLNTLWKERISYLLCDYIVYFSVINLKYKSNLHLYIFFLLFDSTIYYLCRTHVLRVGAKSRWVQTHRY